MANEQNLIPNEARTPEERRANACKAGKASGVARAKKKTLQNMKRIILKAIKKERRKNEK